MAYISANHDLRVEDRPAISRTIIIGLAVIVLVGAAAGVLVLSSGRSSSTNSTSGGPPPVTVDIQIIEDDPVLQIQHFYPGSFSVMLNQNVTLAVRNGDDEPRTFVLKDFGVNQTMGPGTTGRVTFHANKAGTFIFYSPPSVPSPVSQGRPGKYIQGNMTVTQ